MEPTSLTDVIAAQHAYAAARSQALEAAEAQGADPKVAARAQQQALLQYLQARVSLLTKARANALRQFDADLATFQQKIAQVQQLLQEDAAGTPSTTIPTTTTVPDAPRTAPKKATVADPKKGG